MSLKIEQTKILSCLQF